ncbi:protein sel-1-like protein 3 [Platysternon megacephalum]|uniref:Protein sel-1-like protein 3 n=1 Tax=Platysternon megacephalum TaxID=55544 RepID=A0A4D9FBA9_9SAUR|nr:protein sel-1-like protein 3 [Platysternon megacephalum]
MRRHRLTSHEQKLLMKQTNGRASAPGITVQRVNIPGVPVLTRGRSLTALAVQQWEKVLPVEVLSAKAESAHLANNQHLFAEICLGAKGRLQPFQSAILSSPLLVFFFQEKKSDVRVYHGQRLFTSLYIEKQICYAPCSI